MLSFDVTCHDLHVFELFPVIGCLVFFNSKKTETIVV